MMKYKCEKCDSYTCPHQVDIETKTQEAVKNAEPYKGGK